MNRNIKFLLLLCAVIIFSSCEVSDPGSPLANRPPTTTITSAPQNGSTVNHYLTLRWSGNDGDGEIAGFNMYIDGELVALTQRTDSSISFASPATGELVSHTFKIQAVDDDGAVDPDAPQIQFFTSNVAPTCAFSSDNTVRPNSNVAPGFRIKLEADDANRSGVWFAVSIDDTIDWSAWSTDSVFMFANLSLGDFPGGLVALSNAELTEGNHTIYARCRDSGSAISNTISLPVNVSFAHTPVMGELTARYNHGIASDSLYPDGSIYRTNNAELVVAFEASAFSYRGVVHSYRYRESEGAWSTWVEVPELVLTDLPIGIYEYEFQARDVAGALSDTAIFFANLVDQQLSDSILIIDETRDFNGGPGTPTDGAVDDFYAALVEGFEARAIDLQARYNQDTVYYVSAHDVENIGLIIWHADDRNTFQLGDFRRILSEFMQRGGRVIFSGWDIMRAFTPSDTLVEYSGSMFEYRYLRAFTAARASGNENLVAQATGFIGENGFPNVEVDSTKLLPFWHGAMPRAWIFEPRGECTTIGRLTTIDPDYFQNGEVTAYYYDLSFRVAVFGVPLFFYKQPHVEALFDVLLPRMLLGLGT